MTFIPQPTPPPPPSIEQSLSLPVPSGDPPAQLWPAPPAQLWPAPPGPWRASSPSQHPPHPPPAKVSCSLSLSTCAFWWSSSTAVACSSKSLKTFIPQPTTPTLPLPAKASCSLSLYLCLLVILQHSRGLLLQVLDDLHPSANCPPPPPSLSLYLCLLVILQHSHGLLLQVLEELYPPANNPPIPPPPPQSIVQSLSLPVPSGDPPAQPWPAPPGPWRVSSGSPTWSCSLQSPPPGSSPSPPPSSGSWGTRQGSSSRVSVVNKYVVNVL